MIKKLNEKETKTILEKIETFRDDPYYKDYFTGSKEDTDISSMEETYLINDLYFIDFSMHENECWFGVIKLDKDKKVSNSVYDVVEILLKRLPIYKRIYLWCKIDNDVAVKFHRLLIDKYNANNQIIDGISYTEVNYDELPKV